MARVDAFLERTGVGPTTLCRQAVGDPNLVRQLRHGRSPTLATVDQIMAFMEGFDEAGVDPVSSRSDRLRDSSPKERRGRAMTRTMVQEMEVPIRIVRLPAVQARTGLGRSTIYVRLAEGSFPRPVPRGARVVGTARAVQDRDQSRLAVAFHRLLLPDGSWIDLEFTGLNQAGEGALQDQVDRHYFSTFAAAGAVGVVSGLALAGGSPFGLRAGVGQGLGQSATSVLDRFLNRLPTITIRAGHRLRIWFTSDVLVPRAGTRQ